jgi:dipeptidase
MVEKLTQMDQLLPKLFKTGSVTYLRYKSAINTALTPYLENLSTYRMLHSQVWEANNTDTGYWQTLTAPILERHEHITEVLTKLHREMQMEVAKGGKADDFALQDIEGLAERLGKY